MSVYFVSDLHLDSERPASNRAFIEVLKKIRTSAEALYILGDFVEYWLGDDDNEHRLDAVFDNLAELTRAGVPVYFMHGNRDFLMGKDFLQQYEITLLPGPTLIDLHGQKTLLMHGDSLCTKDPDYQNFRRMVRDPQWQIRFLEKSLPERRAIAISSRRSSREIIQDKPEYIMDVDQQTVIQIMLQNKVQRLIHGHTHRPGIHRFMVDGKTCERIVLGDWYEGNSILRFDRTAHELLTLEQLV
jgi:UDP-2,3-diacylglucosamine hydrolase